MINKNKFIDFEEYWQATKDMLEYEREDFFKSLPKSEQHKIKKSYEKGGWEDLFLRNKIDKIIDEVKTNKNIDLIAIRSKLIGGKSIFISRKDWEIIYALLFSTVTDKKHLHFIYSGIEVNVENENTLLLTYRSKNDKKEDQAS